MILAELCQEITFMLTFQKNLQHKIKLNIFCTLTLRLEFSQGVQFHGKFLAPKMCHNYNRVTLRLCYWKV